MNTPDNMLYVGCIDRTAEQNKYTVFSQSKPMNPNVMKGYFASHHSRDMLDAIHTGNVLNCIEYGKVIKVHALLQTVKPTPTMLDDFIKCQFCIGLAKGIRKYSNAQAFFSSSTDYVNATLTPTPKIQLVPEMRMTHALTGPTVIKVLSLLLRNGYIAIDDILVFNLTHGDFWNVVGV